MRPPPYAKAVKATPGSYWVRGTRIVIFAGPQAWDWARWWFGDPAGEMSEGKAVDPWDPADVLRAPQRYALVLPPADTASAELFGWPVRGREVRVADTAGDVEALAPLIRALQRDGCAGGEVFDLSVYERDWGGYFRLLHFQPWRQARWDAELVAQANQAAAERALAQLGPPPWPAPLLEFIHELPPDTLWRRALSLLDSRAIAA